jgi:chromate transport protein ChrA
MHQLMSHIKSLGYGGLLPFVLLLSGLLMLDDTSTWHAVVQRLLIFYSAVIITFVGALNWGLALASEAMSISQRTSLLTYSVLPSLIVCLLLLLPAPLYLLACAVLYVACFAIDSRLTLPALPVEYGQMRRKLSFSVAGVLVMASQLVN